MRLGPVGSGRSVSRPFFGPSQVSVQNAHRTRPSKLLLDIYTLRRKDKQHCYFGHIATLQHFASHQSQEIILQTRAFQKSAKTRVFHCHIFSCKQILQTKR